MSTKISARTPPTMFWIPFIAIIQTPLRMTLCAQIKVFAIFRKQKTTFSSGVRVSLTSGMTKSTTATSSSMMSSTWQEKTWTHLRILKICGPLSFLICFLFPCQSIISFSLWQKQLTTMETRIGSNSLRTAPSWSDFFLISSLQQHKAWLKISYLNTTN